MPRSDVRKVIEAMEDEVMEIIALEDEITFSFGKIEGYTKPPWRITGAYKKLKMFQDNGHWSYAKVGFPKCTFSKQARDYLIMDPNKYFEMPEHRYTTNARQFRIDNELEEIPEYQGLPEEKIQELCLKADKVEKGIRTPTQEKIFKHDLKKKERIRRTGRSDRILNDIMRQLESGIPMEQVVIRDDAELLKEYEEIEEKRQESYAKSHTKIERERERFMR